MSNSKRSLDTIISKLGDDDFIKRSTKDLKMAWWLLKQRDVPIVSKMVPVLSLLYVLAPVDVLPDFIPLLGQMDDIAVVMLAIRLFMKLAPAEVIGRYEADIAEAINQTAEPTAADQ